MGELVVTVGQQAAIYAAQSAAASYITGALSDPLQGPRLESAQLQTSSEGAGLPLVYGRVRLGGQIIWATRFKETKTTKSADDGKGGPRVDEYSYSASFAVAIAMGPIDGVGRVWADGRPLSLDKVTWRLYRGTEDQQPDPLIEAVEGTGDVSAFRGVAYIVFENLALDAFGDRLPQLNFEVFRAPASGDGQPRLEALARGVTLIPGSGEFAYATTVVRRDVGPGVESFDNLNNARGQTDVLAAIDDLETHLPHCASVMLVVSWFGDDLRLGACQLRPGVETRDKTTRGLEWRVQGLTRTHGDVLEVSRTDDRPNYGGTPSDNAVLEAIAELKARGFKVALYPFILMDVPTGNGFADPYGGAEQAAFPWRGRITCHPAAGQPGTVDKTAVAASQIAAFIGTCTPEHFSASDDTIAYAGPDEWSLRRMILHYARLAEAAGGVDAFVIASEMRGLTQVRDDAGAYPAVAGLQTLAADVRSILGPDAKLTYAADWSEYFGHQPQDGTGDVFFHLDPLWADANIDMVGIDWYAPQSDWRDGADHTDAAAWPSIYDRDYLQANVEGGEGHAWYYASQADRAAQIRTPITDGSGKPWVFRYKDLRHWWSNAHYDRPGGVEAVSPTAWVPQSKPIWFVEAGCPAVDKGANQPNVFVDPKSSESQLPHFSSGARDDLIQRRMLEALLSYWEPAAGRNPTSSVYGGPMIAWESIHLWTWDARPFPDFPSRLGVWSDGENWRLGHWLNGRTGLALLSGVVADVCAQAGLASAEVDAAALEGLIAGYIIANPTSARSALEPLARAYRFTPAEQSGALAFLPSGAQAADILSLADAVADSAEPALRRARADAAEAPLEARVRFYNEARDYQVAAASARQLDAVRRRVLSLTAPLVLDHAEAEAIAIALMSDAAAGAETAELSVPPSRAGWEVGDTLSAPDLGPGDWRITAVEGAGVRRLTLSRMAEARPPRVSGPIPGVLGEPAAPPARPFGVVLDVPLLPSESARSGPRAVAAAAPWPGSVVVSAGAQRSERGVLDTPADLGALVWDLWPGPVGRWDEGNVMRVSLSSGELSSASVADVLAGANVIAVAGALGEWEILQFREAALVSAGVYELRGLLRGQAGTQGAMAAPVSAGARVVVLNGASLPVSTQVHERGETLSWRFAPSGGAATGDGVHTVEAAYQGLHLRPLSPVHVRALRDAAGVRFSWVRRTRIDGDDWSAEDVPLGETDERYRLELLDGGATVWSADTTAPSAMLSAAEEAALFAGAPLGAFSMRVAQLSEAFGAGAARELTVYVHS